MKKNSFKTLLFVILSGVLGTAVYFSIQGFTAPKVDFNGQVRPILNSRCVSCHGGVKKNGGLSLLFRENALAPGESGKPAIVPGKPDSSELIRRILHNDPELRMPLNEAPLKPEEVEILSRWIAEGAQWEPHWAFLPISLPEVPATSSDWVQNDIDRFVWRRLKAEKLSPNKEADKATLLRRVSLDLTGLPPTPEAYAAFMADPSPQAYEKVVDSLLASPHFGERWTAMWLDLARYADSQGYQKDRGRQIWQYRDWLIDAFNQDMPFDQFTTEQLAGDLLNQPTKDQLIATAFHRNTMTNDEGGTDDEEFRVAAVIDRVNTTMEVWQGITIGCVQCHSHPYDPFEHQEYYELYAFFNNTADADKTHEFPTISVLSSVQERKIREIEGMLANFGEADTANAAYQQLKEELASIQPSRTPILQELPADSSRVTHIFERGNWLVHGEAVSPDVPASLSPMEAGMPANRLGLSQWLLSPDNPLTSRVIVNRFWEQIFGVGIVKTLEDFGTQGDKPSYPDLLDYLAYQFMHDYQWSVKTLLKEMVTSATYRQGSMSSPALHERDPDNQLLARGPRFRLSAEQIRDQALAVSGLLSYNMYGPSVMPPQPEGVWNTIRHVMRWRTSEGEDKYRRAIYTYIRRSSPYPSFLTFDSPSRDLCVSRRIRTNTPLQALVTLNDIVYLEAAEGLASIMIGNSESANPMQSIQDGYMRMMGKSPSPEKLEALTAYYEQTLAYYQEHPEEAAEFLPLSGEAHPERAAMTTVANVMLNLDEFLTKE